MKTQRPHELLAQALPWFARLAPDVPHLIGVSGGRDSMVLLHALHARGFSKLVVCHLDHALREESAEDARFVANFAAALGLECVLQREEVAALRGRSSLETAARECRYRFFASVAEARGCARLLLAHHADDQVETLLLQLFRGAGGAGLAGMRRLSTRIVEGAELEIHRPLLGVWREEFDAYAAAHALPFREDVSNADPKHTRNRMRNEILPALGKSFGRDIRRAIWRSAEILGEEDAWISNLPELSGLAAELDVSRLRAQPIALQRRTIHRWLKNNGIRTIDFDDVENVRALLTTERRAKANLSAGIHARRRSGRLWLQFPSSSEGDDRI